MNNNIKDNIKAEDKKEFMKWVIKNEQLPKREALWILNYMLSAPTISNLTFVDTFEESEDALLFIYTKSGEDRMKKFGLISEGRVEINPEKIFHYVRENNNKVKIYIDFKNKYQNEKYLKVLESQSTEHYLTPQVLEEANSIIRKMERENILKMIDKALDQKDEEMFMELWRMYLGMENK